MSKISVVVIIIILSLTAIQSVEAQYNIQTPAMKPKAPKKDSWAVGGMADLNFSSEYIWRGVELNHEWVMQPAARISEKGLELSALGNMDLTSSNGCEGKFTRWIYKGGLAHRVEDGGAGIFYTYYDNRDVGYPKTQEVSIEVEYGYPFFGGGDMVYDWDNANGFYFRTKMGYIGEIGILSIIPQVSVSFATNQYQEFYFGVHEDSFVDVVVSLRAELNVVSGLFVYAEGNYYELCKSALRSSEVNVKQGENFYWQGGAAFRF